MATETSGDNVEAGLRPAFCKLTRRFHTIPLKKPRERGRLVELHQRMASPVTSHLFESRAMCPLGCVFVLNSIL